MPLAFDASSSVYQASTVASQDLTHTCTGSDRVLVVFTRTYDGTGVTGVTYNGVSLTQNGGSQTLGSDSIRAWVLHAPASGANTITATISPNRRIEIYAVSLTGASQSSTADATAYATGSSTSATGSVTTVEDNAWVVANTGSNGASGLPASGTNCTATAGISGRGSAGYGGPRTPAGSFTQALTWSGAGSWSFFQIAIAPSLASGPANLKSLDTNIKANIKSYNTNILSNIKSINTNV